ncbi:class I adenylate-forming enzyme family protein [Patulibacter minatonensis]|uniref:class I adenylate-forming enzyme family protein n=1 Tax=Patulibacter minatonensis TaxID=298163 RepID=UPI00047CEB94|nr:AMP-binding protein [Patulibacter minatonensis]
MTIDVEALYDRRADDRWNRVAVGDVLERMTWSDPDKVAMVASEDAIADPRYARVTYREADRLANRVANALLARGLRRGDRVAMLCENSVEAYLTKIGIAKAGLVAFPVNTMMAPDVVEHMLRHVDVHVGIVDADMWAAKGRAFVAAGVEPIATIAGALPGPEGATPFEAFVAGVPDTEPDVRIHGDDVWEILSTSGTTAMPKAVMISHTYTYMAAMSHAMSYTRGLEIECDLVTCSFLPVVFHIGDHAHVFSAWMTGGTVVLGRRPEPARIAAAAAAHGVTCLWGGSPQLLEDLAREVERAPEAHDLSRIEVVIYGWSAMSADLADRLQALFHGVRFVCIFGQTEAIACHRFWPHRWPEVNRGETPAVNNVGIPAPMLGATVVDVDGTSLRDRPGEQGEAVYRSPAIASGYFRDEAATTDAFRGGWFHSGDMCEYDAEGRRVMVDRFKDVVKSGGENVSSIRVEGVLMQHPAVDRAAVVGLPHERWGEAVTGVVVTEPEVEVDAAELIAFCRARLAGFETPKRIVFRDELPTTVGGKVLKYRLREMLR